MVKKLYLKWQRLDTRFDRGEVLHFRKALDGPWTNSRRRVLDAITWQTSTTSAESANGHKHYWTAKKTG